jgi:DNA-binding NtrC family response regulator
MPADYLLPERLTAEEPTNSGRVRVIDDKPPLLRVYMLWLRSAGYAVDCAADVHGAVKAPREKRIDVVVTDIAMQGMGRRGLPGRAVGHGRPSGPNVTTAQGA